LALGSFLLLLGGWFFDPNDYRPKFAELVLALRAASWLWAIVLIGRATLPARSIAGLADLTRACDVWLDCGKRRVRSVLASGALIFTVVYGSFSIARHECFNSGMYDLAVYDQAVWNTGQGRWLETSIEARPDRYMSLLADHFAPILTLLTPVYWIWPHVHALLLCQTLALASGALCVFAIARHRLGSSTAAVAFAAAYLLYPAIGFVNRFDFHPVALSIPLLLAGLLAAERGRWRVACVCIAAAMLCKEDLGLAVAMYGVTAFLLFRKRRLGVSLFVAGLTASVLAMFVVLPAFRGEPSDTWERYQHWGATPSEALLGVLTHPAAVIKDVFQQSPLKAAFIIKLLLPLAFLPLLHPVALLGALPALAYNLASGNPSQSSIYFHYVSPIVPFFFYAAILGAERLSRGLSSGDGPLPEDDDPRRERSSVDSSLVGLDGDSPQRTVPSSLGLLPFTVLASTILSLGLDFPLTKKIAFPFWEVHGIEKTCDVAAIRAVGKQVPERASLAATLPLGPHFAHRRNLRLIWPAKSAALPNTDYILADLADFRWNSIPNARAAKQNLVILLTQSAANGYGVVHSEGSVLLLRRGAGNRASVHQIMALLDRYLGAELRGLMTRIKPDR